MNKVSLYLEANQLQRSNTQQVLQQFKSVLKWRSDGNDSILDAGCGPGDVTIDSLLSILPTNFDRLVGVDISKEMIAYARETKIHPKVSFEQFDLEVELEKQPLNGMAPFDHITSFFCLMMIQNQRTCIQNFYKLLKPEGDMLLVFLAGHPLYDIYKTLSLENRWAEYMTDVDQKISPYHYSEQPAEEFQKLLSDCGFKICDVQMHNKEHVFDNAEQLKSKIMNVYLSVCFS